MNHRYRWVVIVYLLLLFCTPLTASSQLNKTILIDHLSYPWGMTFLPDHSLLITEKVGRLLLFKEGKLRTIVGLPSDAAIKGQGGLMDIVIDENFSHNRWVYLSYVAKKSTKSPHLVSTTVIRATLINDRLTNHQQLFQAQPFLDTSKHFGSRLLIDKDYLYISLGDRGQKHGAQSLKSHWGSLIRIHTDGRIPTSNPFYHTTGAKKEIYSYGHRNIQGMILNQKTQQLWVHEHGPKGGDELNLIQKGANYGWPKVTHGIGYDNSIISNHTSLPGYQDPTAVWIPSIAPCGMMRYTGSMFSEYQGNLFIGALKKRHLRRVVLAGTTVIEQEKLLSHLLYRIRDVEEGPEGAIYVLTDGPEGKLLKLYR